MVHINKEKFSDASIEQNLGLSGKAQVDLFNGNLTFVHTDVQYNYGNPIISVGHVYSTKSQSTGVYGNNWSLNCDEKVEILEGAIRYTDSTGSVMYFYAIENDLKDNYAINIDVDYEIIYGAVGSNTVAYMYVNESALYQIVIQDDKGNKKYFKSLTISQIDDGLELYLVKIETVEGNVIIYVRNEDNSVSQIRDNHGRYVNFTYSSGKLSQIVDRAGRKKIYGYTGNNLTTISYKYPDNTTETCLTIAYDTNNLITRITGENGISYKYEYPQNSARVSKVILQSAHKVISVNEADRQEDLSYATNYESWDITYNLDKLGISKDENGNEVVISEYDEPFIDEDGNEHHYGNLNSKVVNNEGVTLYYGFKKGSGTYYYNAISYEGDPNKIGVAKDTMSLRTSQSSDALVVSTAKDNLLKNPNFDGTESDPVKGNYPMDWQGFYEGENENYVTINALDSTSALIIPADGREHCIYQSVNNEIITSSLGEEYDSLTGGMYTLCAWIKGGDLATTKDFTIKVKYYNCQEETVTEKGYENITYLTKSYWTYVIKSAYVPSTKIDSNGIERKIESIKVCINFSSTSDMYYKDLVVDRVTLNHGKANVMKSTPILLCKTTNGEIAYTENDVDYDNSTIIVNAKPNEITALWIQLQSLAVNAGVTKVNLSNTKIKFNDGNEYALKDIRVVYNNEDTLEDSYEKAQIKKDTKGNPITQNLWNRGKENAIANAFNVTKTYDNKHRELTSLDYRGIQTTNTYTEKTDTAGEIITQTTKKPTQTTNIYEVSVEKTLDGSAIAKQTDSNGKVTTFDYKGSDNTELVKDRLYKETYPDGSFVQYTYDKKGNVATMTVGENEKTHTFAYSYTACYPTQVIVDNTDTFTYNYDGLGNVISIKKNGEEIASYGCIYRYNMWLPPYKKSTKFGKTYVTEFDVYGNPTSIYEMGTMDYIAKMEYDPNTKECKKINDFTNTDSNAIPDTVWTTTTDSVKTVITASGLVNMENKIYQKNGVVNEEELKIGNDEFYTKFDYETDTNKGKYPDNRLENVTVKDKELNLMAKTSYTYDNLGRVTKKYLKSIWDESTGTEKDVVYNSILFRRKGNSSYLSDNVSNFNTTVYTNGKTRNIQMVKDYTYDDKNNLTNIRYQNLYHKSMMDDTVDDSVTNQSSYVKNVSYVYDEHGKVIRENNQIVNKTFLYDYNDKGNIFQKSETAYTTGEIPETAEMICYNYGYNNNGQLVYVNYEPTGEDIIVIGNYDSYGNPHKYNGNTLTWNGQRLVGYGTNTYQYDMRGLRVSKIVNNVTTNYVYDSESRLVQETKGNQRINYLYNMNDLIGFTIPYVENGVTKQFPFYYVKDAQGNVCYIVDKYGKLVVSYNYDAWGNIVSKYFFKYGVANAKTSYSITLGTVNYTASDIDNLNRHYYRGYYLDKETGFYYLTTRYYDPKTGRFISPDDPKYLDFEVAYGYNRYAYCCNNPIMYIDPDGCEWQWNTFWTGLGMVITAVGAIALSVTTFGAGTPLAMAIVAGVTLGAGVLSGINGVATMIEAGTQYNFVRDGVFNGLGWSDSAYNIYAGIVEGIAVVGSMVLGFYHKTGQYKAAKYGQKYLGKGYTKAGYTKAGTPRYVSKDGLRQMRFDKPHMYKGKMIGKHLNLEFFKGTKPIPYEHVLYDLFNYWII